MIIIIIFIFFYIAIRNVQINEYVAKYIFQDEETYNEIQQKYPLITNHKKPIYIFFHICTQFAHKVITGIKF
jgi:hypothetical protein